MALSVTSGVNSYCVAVRTNEIYAKSGMVLRNTKQDEDDHLYKCAASSVGVSVSVGHLCKVRRNERKKEKET